ncbi:MAG: hypothetical protein B7Z36_03430 [Novosphingobium sp. 12-63-9]|nr:MAG: hypothetical protein B7Z36_03430 [Novosphingobium sp. 12-63-9]
MPYVKSGAEFVINAERTDTQLLDNIHPLANGGFIADWIERPGSLTGAFVAQAFSATGGVAGTQITLPSPLGIELTGGRFVEVSSESNLALNTNVVARFANATLTDFSAATSLADRGATDDQLIHPAAAALPGGGFVVTWIDSVFSSNNSVVGQVFSADGKPVTSQFAIGERFGRGYAQNNDVAALSDGHIVALWNGRLKPTFEILNADGTPAHAPVAIDTYGYAGKAPQSGKLTALHDGMFVFTWQEGFSPDVFHIKTSIAIHAQVFDSAGKAVSADIIVDSSDRSDGIYSVAALANGDFAVAWGTESHLDQSVDLRVFTPTGSEVGKQQVVNTTLAGNQHSPVIASLANGDFVVGWTEGNSFIFNQTGSRVVGQVFSLTAPIVGSSKADKLTGTAGDDTLEGKAGDDVLNGGTGSDTASYEHAARAVAVSLAVAAPQGTGADGTDTLRHMENLLGSTFADTLTGNGAANRLDGGAGNDTLIGNGGNDTLIGGAGADNLVGGTGADSMEGGLGRDIYFVDSAKDVVREGPLGGTDTVVASVSYSLSAYVDRLELASGAGNIKATGNYQSNVLIGNEGDNVLDGRGGADTLTGGAGHDSFVFGTWYVGGVGAGPFGASTSTQILPDSVTDFNPGEDHLDLSRLAYAGLKLLPKGTLLDVNFALGTAATTQDHHVIYNQSTGVLWYDDDGSGAHAAVKIATLANHADLHASDIVLI